MSNQLKKTYGKLLENNFGIKVLETHDDYMNF
jgi:hypothetical protein